MPRDASHPDDLADILSDPSWNFVWIEVEAGPLSQWLFNGFTEAGLPAVCIETRHAKAFLKAQVNETDRNDVRVIAQMMYVNLFRCGWSKDKHHPKDELHATTEMARTLARFPLVAIMALLES